MLELRNTVPRNEPTQADLKGRAQNPDDLWHRKMEWLFERLVKSWTIAGLDPITDQRELLGRFRAASQTERAWVLATVRSHVAGLSG